jgi:phytoene dehydrogenase-like protein
MTHVEWISAPSIDIKIVLCFYPNRFFTMASILYSSRHYRPLLIVACVLGCLLPIVRGFLPAPTAPIPISSASFQRQTLSNQFPTYHPCQCLSLSASVSNSNDNSSDDNSSDDNSNNVKDNNVLQEVDVCIIGAGLGGLCAGAILNTLYGKTVAVYESHYIAGGCAHAFTRRSPDLHLDFTFDSGPTIMLGCSSPPFNALQQVLQAINVNQESNVQWIPYTAWGMIENPGSKRDKEKQWRLELGENNFQQGPLTRFGGWSAVTEFEGLRQACQSLTAGALIPAMAMRSGKAALIPLLRYPATLLSLMQQGETVTGTFAPFLDGPLFVVKDIWLRNWLDALAFSLSGLPAARTSAAAMAFVLEDMHRKGAALDYPVGGMGSIVDALVNGVEQGDNKSQVHLRQTVASIDIDDDSDGKRVKGITLANGKVIRARNGVICNAPVWSLKHLIKDERMLEIMNDGKDVPVPSSETEKTTSQASPPSSWSVTEEGASMKQAVRPPPNPDSNNSKDDSLLQKCDTAERTGSFLHLHLAINATGLDLSSMEAHYTVMDRSLAGDGTVTNGVPDGPCGELNMIAVSNPCVIDNTLAPAGYMVLHAYGAGNEPFEIWDGLDQRSAEYKQLKEERADVLWRAVESVIPDVRERTVLKMIGSPLTHERFLRRPKGTYGSATEDYLKDGTTPFVNLMLAGDGCFPGIGVPAVAISGASAANALVGVLEQWRCLDKLQRKTHGSRAR